MRERIYYEINEQSARSAHEMMSFRDYKEGSLTAEYKGYVDEAYDLADKVAESRPEEVDRVYGIADRYSKKMAANLNDRSRIGCMCSISYDLRTGKLSSKEERKTECCI